MRPPKNIIEDCACERIITRGAARLLKVSRSDHRYIQRHNTCIHMSALVIRGMCTYLWALVELHRSKP